MWSKELKKKKRISTEVSQTLGMNSALSSNSSGGSNSGNSMNVFSQQPSSIPLSSELNNQYSAISSTGQVNTSNLLNLNAGNNGTQSNQGPNGTVLSGFIN